MVDLREFLSALGLPQYTQAFVENDIDGAALVCTLADGSYQWRLPG